MTDEEWEAIEPYALAVDEAAQRLRLARQTMDQTPEHADPRTMIEAGVEGQRAAVAYSQAQRALWVELNKLPGMVDAEVVNNMADHRGLPVVVHHGTGSVN